MSRPVHAPRKPAIRRDADGVTSIAQTWESLVERLIREAQARGDFDALPGHGRPLLLDEDPREGDMGLAFHMLRNARLAPPWIEADKQVRACIDDLDRMLEQARAPGRQAVAGRISRHRLHRQLDQLIETHDEAVTRLNAAAPSLALHRRPMDRDAQRRRLDVALGLTPPPVAGQRITQELAGTRLRPSG
jgi:hypothetical protein